MADEEKPPAKGGGDNPITHILNVAKDVPWYYYAGAALAGGALLFGATKGGKSPTSASGAAADTGLPMGYTTSPLDFAMQDGSGAQGGGGYGVTPPPSTTPPPGSTVTPPMGHEYIVQLGDTLDSIAKRYKIPGGWQSIYANNETTIIAAAKASGRTSNYQNYIYQGEHLYLPTS